MALNGWRFAEDRFVWSVKEECLDRIVPLGEWHLRKTPHEFATHYMASEITSDPRTS